MSRILISVTTDAGEHAAIGLDVQERHAKEFLAMIHRCEGFAMNYETSSTLAAAIKFLVDPKVVKWSELKREIELPPSPAVDFPPEVPKPKTKLANG